MVDWFFVLDDQRGTAAFTRLFGAGHIQFFGMLVIGRSADLDAHDMGRLQWRADRVSINTHKIFCYTYDDLLSDLERNWQAFSRVGRHPVDPRLMIRITGGKVYDPANHAGGTVRDVCIDGGKVVADATPGCRTIDATGLVVFPGGVDVHTHVAGRRSTSPAG